MLLLAADAFTESPLASSWTATLLFLPFVIFMAILLDHTEKR